MKYRFNQSICLLASAALSLLAAANAVAANLTNFIQGFAYSNANMVITAGDTVKWINNDGASHSVTGNANNSPAEAFCGNPTFGLNGSCTHTFTNVGTFGYFCRVHPSMVATLVVMPKANTPPTVTVTNPPSGAVFLAPASVMIGAMASDSDGSVAQVQFFVSGNSAGVATTVPYAATTNNLPAGNYTLSAVATDNQGGKDTNSIDIVVNESPLVNIFSPTNGATFTAPAVITVEATASDPGGGVSQVEFFSNGASLGMVTMMPYGVTTPSLSAGDYTFSAVATDNLGAKSTNSVMVMVKAPVTAPLLISPMRGPSGKFRFDFASQVGQTYLIDAATNLGQWSLLGTTNAATTTVRFIDDVTTLNQRFYRVRTP